MKRLNLNNTIATTAMLTKMNAMKNKMNLFAKVFMFVVMMGIMLPQVACGQEPWFNDGSWWILKKESIYMGWSATSASNKNTDNFSVYIPNTGATVTYSAWIEDKASNWPYFYLNVDNVKVIDGINNSKQCSGKYCANDKHSETYNISNGSKHIQGFEEHRGCSQTRRVDIKIPLPHHTDVLQGTGSYTFQNTQISNTSDPITVNFADYFKSFYTTDTITATITGTDASCFHFTNNQTSITIANANTVYASTDCFSGGVGSIGSTQIQFTPNAAKKLEAKLKIKYDGGVIYIDLVGQGMKKTPSFNWLIDGMALDESAKNFDDIVGMNENQATGTITLVETNSDGTTPVSSPKLVISNTQVSIKEGATIGSTYLKATYTSNNQIYDDLVSVPKEFTISQNQLQERNIYWTADFTGFRDNSGTFDLSTSAWKATTDPNNSNVDYYSIGDPTIASINGTILTIHKEGITTITATKNADNNYKKVTLTKPLIVSSSSGCNSSMINENLNTTSNYTCPPFNGRPKKVLWTVSANDVKGAEGTVYLKTIGGITIDWKDINRDSSEPFETVIPNDYLNERQFRVEGLVSGSYWFSTYKRTLNSFQVIMASYLEPIANNSISFEEYDIASTTPLTPNIATYADLFGNINVEIVDVVTGSNNTYDCFKFENGTQTSQVAGGCGNQGTASIKINFTPKQIGEHKARLKVSAYDGNSDKPVTFYIPITGSGRKITQTLTWNNNPTHPIFTGTYHALSNDVILTDAAKTSGVTTSVGGALTVEYSSSDNTVAEVKKDANGIQYLDFKKAGTFKLRANCEGNAVYSDAAQIESGDIAVSLATPTLTFSALPISIPVFSATTLTASSYTEAKINMTVISKKDGTNPNATLSKSTGIASGEDVTLTANTRASDAGEGNITVVASIDATEIYEAVSKSVTVNTSKVTPVLQCSIESLERTALTNLYLTEMPVTITNSTTLWHDIAVTYSSDNESIAKFEDDHFRLLKSGTCTITVKVEAGINNNASLSPIQIGLTVNKADQAITWNLSADEQATHYSGDSFTLTATCPANNITYTSSNENIATVSNGVLTFHNAGTVTITAHSDGDDIYSAAIDVPKTFSAALSSFADTYIGQASTSQSIDLSNLSGATSLTLSSSNPTVFRAFTNNEAGANTSLNNSLNISGATTVNVKFYPESVGEVSGTITISGNNGKSIAIPVKGKGLQQSVTFGSTNARIPRGTIESRTISLDNMVSNAGYTVTSNGQPFIVSQPQNGKFTIVFLPQNNTDISEYNVTIHDKAFGTTTTHDYKIKVEGHADAIETVDFGSVNARSTSSTTRQITLSGVDKVPGLKIASDENTSYLIDNNSSAITATDGQHTISFTPVHYGTYNGKDVYLYLADNPTTKYQLLKCNGVGNQVDLSEEINWVNTTISTQENTTGMAVINNTTYRSYVRLYYTNSGGFFDYNNHPTDLEIDKTEIFAPTAGVSTVTAHVEALDGSNDFIGESSAEITATDKPIQKISYSSNIYYVVLNDDVVVDVYAYDSKNPSTRIDADFTMTCADSKVTITKGNYDNTNYVQQFTIHGAAAGSTTVSITSTPKGTSSGYESATETGIPVTILPNGSNCIVSVLDNPSKNTFNTSGPGEQKTFQLTGAPCRSFKATLNYKFGTPTLNISDGTNTLENTTYDSNISTSNTKTEYITYKYNAASKHKPSILTVNLTGTNGFFGIKEGTKELTITEFSQLSYFDVISNHPNGSDIDFRSVSVGSASVNETIKVDYSALHKAVELSLTDETNFTIVNKAEVLGKITNCGLWGELYIIVKYNPTVAGTHTATLTIKGYTTDDNNNESIKTYTYTLKGQSSKRTQIITWDNDNKYSIMYLVPERTLELKASSNQPVYGSTNPMPITYTFGNDGDGVATLTDGVLTIAKAGTITVIAHQAGDEYTEAATDVPLTITFTLEPQHIVWRNEDWSGNKDSDTKTIFTDALTSTGYELKILVQDSHGADLSHDPEFRIENEINCSGETDLIRIEKNANDNKFYAYYNNRGTGKVKITATHSGNASYSQMEAADEKSMYLVIEKRTPSITYNEDQLNEVYVGDRIDALTRPTTTIDFPAAIFNYDASTNINFSQNADAYVTLTKNDDNTTSLDAIHTTDGSIIYIHAKQQYNECYNDEATSGNIVFTVKKTPIAIEWNQTLDLSTGQYDANGAVYQLEGKVRDTRHDKIIDNLAIAYSLTISDKGCNDIPNDQIAKIEGNQLHVYGATSATLTITASQDGTTTDGYADYNAAENVQREFTIQKITPTITFEPQTSMVYGDKVALTASSAYNDIYSSDNDEDKVFRFTSSSTEITVNGNYMEARGVTTGSGVTLTASQDNNCMIENVADVGGNVTVNLAPQKMVWGGDTSINIDVAGTQSFTFNPYAIDKNHINQEETWLTLTDGQFKTESEVEYEIRNVSICGDNPGETEMVSIDGNGVIKATGKGTGVVRIYAKAVGDLRYAEITDDEDKVYIEVTVETVKPEIQSFDISSLDDIHYGDRVKLSSPTTSYFVNQGDNKTTFSYANNDAYDIGVVNNDTMFDAKAVVTGYTIVATQEAIACFNQASDAFTRGTFNIAKSEQEIEWNNQTTLSIDGVSNDYQTDRISLTAKAMDKRHKAGGSQTWLTNLETELPVTYTFADGKVEKCADDADIISIDENGMLTATGLGSGTVTITATQVEGNETYNGITADEDKKSITVTVNKITPDLKIYDAEGSSLNGETLSVYYGDPEYTQLACQVTFAGTDNELKDASGNTLYSINDIILTDDGQGVVTINGNGISFNKAGIATITATLKADCRVSQDVTATFYINVQKPDQTIKYIAIDDVNTGQYTNPVVIDLNDHFKAYDGSHSKYTGGTIVYDVTITQDEGCSGITFDNQHTTITIDGTGSGSVSIKATQDGTDASGNTNYIAAETTQLFHVNKITPTITLDAISGTIHYGDEITLHAIASCTDYADDSNNSGTKIKFKYSGTEITDDTFTVKNADGKLTVQAFMGADCQINSTASSEAEYDIAPTAQEIVWTQSDMNNSYTTLNNDKTFTLDAYAIDAVHKASEIKTGATVEYELVLTPDDNSCGAIATLQDNELTITGNGSGTVTVKATCQDVSGKYSAVTTAVEKTFTITKVAPEVTMQAITNVICGSTNGTLAASVSHGGDEGLTFESSNKDTAIVSGSTFTALHAGNVRFRVTKAATCTTNEQTSDYVQATIDKADQTVTWNNNESETLLATDLTNGITLSATATSNITHQATGTQISYSITSGGNLAKIVNGKLVSLGAGTGQVTVQATAGTTVDGYEDYNESSAQITFQVVPDNITFTIAQLDLTYGDQDKAFSVTNDKDLDASGYTMTITNINNVNIRRNATNANHIDAIHASTENLIVGLKFSGMTNYADVETTAVVTVAKAPQTITWDQTFDETYDIFSKILFNATSNADAVGQNNVYYTWTQNSTCDNPVFSGDANNVIIYDATDGAPILAAGVVTITANHRGNENYLPGTSDSKTFTISEATPTLTWATEYTSNQNTNDVIQLEATSNYTESQVQYAIESMTVKGCASISGNQLTCNAPGTVVVKAYQDAIPCVIQRSEIQQIIQIGNGPHTITWKADSYNYKNTDGTINLSSLCTCVTGDITFTSSDNNIATVLGNILTINEITSPENVEITASVAATDEYEAATESKTFSITVDDLSITIDKGGSENNPVNLESLSSVTKNEDFATLLINKKILSCNYETVTYTFASSDPSVATFNENGEIIAYKKTDNLEITVTAHVGNMEATESLYIKIPRGTMRFKGNGNWHDKNNWVRDDILPSAEDHDVSIQANCIIQNDSTAVCYNLNITGSGSLSVSPNAVLNVTDTITNTEASKLTLMANENHSATVLFATGSPSATVENYIRGELHPDGKANNPDWQYRGFVGNNPLLSNWNVVIFKWDETKNNEDCWGKNPVYIKTDNTDNTFTDGTPWDGYCMANYDGQNHMHDYTSNLIPTAGTGNIHEYELSYTDKGDYPNRGVNLITNSWSAPIYMSNQAMEFQGNVEQTFYFYQTRSYKDWESMKGRSFETVPLYTAETVANSSTIASGQSFLLKVKQANTNAKLIIKNNAFANVANGAMYAPAEKERFNVLSITMSIDTMADRLFLLESEKCSGAFDNGYDGTKIKEGNMPQIFASNDFGHTAVNTDKTMLGQRIGYSATKDGALCTITFNTDRLEGFSELYLYDRVARRYADILAGDSYSFTGTKAGEEERFEIVGRRDDGSEFVTSSDMMIEVIGNRALLSGFAGGNDEVFITDMNGKRLWTERASNGPWFELPNLPAGVYLINCGEANCKFIVK